jgi:hypothetical protein
LCLHFASFQSKKLRFLEAFVRMKGLEPPRLTAPDPKSGAATNYATSAFFYFAVPFSVLRCKGNLLLFPCNIFACIFL